MLQDIDVYDAIEKIKNHKHYKKVESGYLRFIYFSEDEFQIGYFIPETKKTLVFYVKPGKKDGDFLTVEESEESNEKNSNSEEENKEINLEDLVITLNDVKQISEEIFRTNYPQERTYKWMYLLEKTDLGLTWRCIVLTNKMQLIVFLICAQTGRLLSAKSEKVFDFEF